jgi:cyclic beta-1,2-glucan synthetase
MNRVGAGGQGESVWNGWFLIACLHRFADVARTRGDSERAEKCLAEAEDLRHAAEEHAWDGAWYRRAWFDDGTPLGSSVNDECQIDSIAQTWAAIAGVADPERVDRAMASVWERLVRRDAGLVLLFTPPFDKGQLQPGYVKGYVPGIRENGGQYTHAATWVLLATALRGHGAGAGELLTMLNPVRRSDTQDKAALYRVEPYAVAGDIYGAPPHTGRGGWTWYTGAAGWLYRVVLETILGFRLHGDTLTLTPCVPSGWRSFELTYRRGAARYQIHVENPDGVEQGVASVSLDGRPCPGGVVPLADDGKAHEVRVVMGK